MNPDVEHYLSNVKKWQAELTALRKIILACGLTEELKWRQPCYTYQDSNIVLISEFKEYCAISFFKGVLIKDTYGILTKPGENSQSVRLIKFTDLKEIMKLTSVLKKYINEAVEIEKAGLKVDLQESKALVFPEELEKVLAANKTFKKAFLSLTPGRQRAYNLYFSAPKQTKTRQHRIEKYMPQILIGKGINDCTCGMSKKMPYCDGSHKNLISN